MLRAIDIARDVDEESPLAQGQPRAQDISFPPPSHTEGGIMASISEEEEDESKEDMKLDRHPRGKGNKAEVNGVVTTMTSRVHNMELGENVGNRLLGGGCIFHNHCHVPMLICSSIKTWVRP